MLSTMKKSMIKVFLLLLGLMHFNAIFAATPCYLTVLNETQFDSAVVETSVHSLLTKYMRPYLQIPAEGLSSTEWLDSVQVKIDPKEPDKIYVLLEQAEQSYIGSGDTIDVSGIQQATLRILMDTSNASTEKILCKKCKKFIVPSISSKVRIGRSNVKSIRITCNFCNHTYRKLIDQ